MSTPPPADMTEAMLRRMFVLHSARITRLTEALRGIRDGVADDKGDCAWWVKAQCDKALRPDATTEERS